MNKYYRTIRAVSTNVTNVFKSANFIVGIAACFVVLFIEVAGSAFSNIDFIREGMGSAYFYNISLHFGYYIYAAPLICAYAVSWLFCDDSEAGLYRLRLLHSGRVGYRNGLWIGTTLSGGLVLFFGVILFALACAIFFPMNVPADEIATLNAWIPLIEGSMSNWNYMLMGAILAFLFGAIWSGVGLTVSIWSQNRYVSCFAPFIICFCSVLILPPKLQPLEMLVQMNWVSFTFTKLFVYQGVLYLIIMLAFNYLFERKVIHGQN